MCYERILDESLLPAYERLKSGLLRLIDEGKISREDAARVLPELRESEDERIRKEIIAFLKHYHTGEGDSVTYDNDWLVYLEKQKEQKPAEWSEEDENKIERLAFLVSVAEEKEMISPSESVDLRNFIKSLRPSWKPSEELLEALHIAAYIREIEFYGGIKDKLRQLYDNLKRL